MNKPKKGREPEISWNALKAEWCDWFAMKRPVLIFGAKFGALMVVLYVILAQSWAERILYIYLEANAWMSNLILNLCWQGTTVNDVTISSAHFAIAIRRGCDAIEPTWLLCAAILAFPGRFRSKIGGMLVGILLLQMLNLVRIATLFCIGSHWPALFPSAHLEVWPVFFILAVLTLFMAWRGWSVEK